MTRKEDERLVGALVKEGLVRKQDLARFDDMAEESLQNKGITKTLVSLLGIDEQRISQIIAKEFNVPLMPSVEGQTWINVQNLPRENLPKYRIIPVFLERKELTIALIDPPYRTVVDLLEKITGKRIVPVIVTLSDFEELSKDGKNGDVAAKPRTVDLENLDVVGHGEKSASKMSRSLKPPVEVLNKIIEAAVDSDTSDIHFENTRKGFVNVRFRIDGVLQRAVTLPQSYASSIPPIIKQASSLDSIGKRKVQEGQAQFNIRRKKVFTRINVIPTSNGEKFTLRILNKILRVISLNEIGMSNHDLVRLRQILKKPDAIILFVGPAGCGKTTTMYAALHELNDVTKHLATVENPIENILDGVNQTSVGSGRDISFSEGGRALFHHDVDVFGVGEIRDKEEAELLIEAGFTGMLALSTVQASDAITSLFRLHNLGISMKELSLSIRGIVAQRFVRKICPHCSENYRPDSNTLELTGLSRLPKRIMFTRGKGCDTCQHTGYYKRVPIFETMIINDEMSTFIHNGSPYGEIKKTAEQLGFTTMRYDGLRKALAGITTLDEVIRVT